MGQGIQRIYISDYSTGNLHKCDLCPRWLPLKYAIIIARRYRISFIVVSICVFSGSMNWFLDVMQLY